MTIELVTTSEPDATRRLAAPVAPLFLLPAIVLAEMVLAPSVLTAPPKPLVLPVTVEFSILIAAPKLLTPATPAEVLPAIVLLRTVVWVWIANTPPLRLSVIATPSSTRDARL